MYNLQLSGFKTKKQVQAFIDWYEGQGEQDSSIWFEESDIGCSSMQVDLHEAYEWKGDTLHAKLIIQD